MTTAQQQVFDCKDLRHSILKYVVKSKFDKEVHDFVNGMIIQNWWKYCRCEKCSKVFLENNLRL